MLSPPKMTMAITMRRGEPRKKIAAALVSPLTRLGADLFALLIADRT
jgi:hypothetical protein